MKKSILVIGIILITQFAKAQNLVPNPGFELFSECPTSIGQFRLTKFWFSGNSGTPEYLREDCPFKMGDAHSGKGYSGAIFFGQYPKVIEYMMVELKDSLKKDSVYCLSFWIRAEESFIYIDQIGMELSADNLKLGMWAPIYLKPSLNSKYNEPIVPQLGWLEVKGQYKSKGKEKYLAIGNFTKPDNHIQHIDEYYGSFEKGWNSYYFIDDVLVRLKSEQNGCEQKKRIDIVSKENDSDPKVQYFNIYFETDKSNPNKFEKERLAAYIDTMNLLSIDYVELIGHTDSVGSSWYNVELSNRRILRIQEILIAELSVRPKFKLNYFGESKPISENETKIGRSRNRRVEIKVVYHDRKR